MHKYPVPKIPMVTKMKPRSHGVALLLGLALAGCTHSIPECNTASRQPPLMPQAVTLTSFNLYNRPFDRNQRWRSATLALLETAADVIALQEVAHWFFEEAPFCSLVSALGFHASVHWHEKTLFFSNGLAILSRYAITRHGSMIFSDNRAFNSKGAIYAFLDTPNGPLAIVNVHLASVVGGPIKASQFAQLRALVESLRTDHDVIVLGDFNESPRDAAFAKFLDQTKGQMVEMPRDSKTWSGAYGLPCNNPKGQLLDTMVLVPGQQTRTWQLDAATVLQPRRPFPSDHCPVVASARPR